MNSEDVITLWNAIERQGIRIWIDGGWAVDAVVGFQTRPHNDLDIAVEAVSVPALRQCLSRYGYSQVEAGTSSEWNFVLADGQRRQVDVHVVVLDEHVGVLADARHGIAYPAGSLTGRGTIAGLPVHCVSAEALLRFKTSYPPRNIDRQDVARLCALLGQQVPETHR